MNMTFVTYRGKRHTNLCFHLHVIEGNTAIIMKCRTKHGRAVLAEQVRRDYEEAI